jgi:hypothetical protein
VWLAFAQAAVRRPGGRLLLRACRSIAAVPDDTGPAVIERVFRDWRTDQISAQDIPSGSQCMPAIVVRLHLSRGPAFRGAGDRIQPA